MCVTHIHTYPRAHTYTHTLSHTHTCIRAGREGERDERIESVGERARETARVRWRASGGEGEREGRVGIHRVREIEGGEDGRELFGWNMYTTTRGGGLGSSTIFKKFNEPYAPS